MNAERHIRAWLYFILHRCCMILSIGTATFFSSEAQHTNLNAFTPCAPLTTVAHYSISCFDLKNSNKIQFPTVHLPCGGSVMGLTHEDTYHELTARPIAGFKGYFDVSRWEKISGDGGVDVTGAPNCILVEGANIAKVTVAPLREAILRIVIPAEGYVAFDWKNIGGSNLLTEAVINSKVYAIKTKGFYRTPLLKMGDTLSLRFQATDILKVQLSNFNFYTNAIGFIERQWTAKIDSKNSFIFSQFISVERPAINNIVFPNNWKEQNTIVGAAAPTVTGFPVLDEDGDLTTLHDQHILDKDDCGYHVRWEDVLTVEAKGYSITRRWQVEDKHNGNVVQYEQKIQAQGTNTNAVPEIEASKNKSKARPASTGKSVS